MIYLLRHGDAEEGDGNARRLTAKGERQARAADRALAALGDKIDTCLTSGHEPDLSAEVARLTGANVKLRKGGLAIVDGSTLAALLRPRDLAAIAN